MRFYYRVAIPEWLKQIPRIDIVHFEILAATEGVKLWSHKLKGKKFIVNCDNEAVVTVINSGRARDPLLQKYMRELAFVSATAVLSQGLPYF